MQAGICGAHAQVAVTLRLRADDRHISAVLGERPVHVADVGDTKLPGQDLVALVHPLGLIGVVGDDHGIEPRVLRDAKGYVLVLDRA